MFQSMMIFTYITIQLLRTLHTFFKVLRMSVPVDSRQSHICLQLTNRFTPCDVSAGLILNGGEGRVQYSTSKAFSWFTQLRGV